MTTSASPPIATNGTPVYEARGLKKFYDEGQVQALRGVTLSIANSEFVTIVGASGSGKSTLLQMLGALDRPSEGTLQYKGEDMAKFRNPSEYRARQVGFVFQAFHLLPTFTAIENVQMPMFETGRSVGERADRAAELLKAVGLEHRMHHFPSKLSGGERQRVAIARSLANDPAVLLADEPTGNLDSKNAGFIMDLIIRLQQERQMTLVLVTHDPGIAQRAGRAIHMRDGQIISDSANPLAASLS